MKIESFTKRLFPSNLGKAGMHDKYITIPKKAEPERFFGSPPMYIKAKDDLGIEYIFPYNKEANGEYRLTRFNDFYLNHNAKIGDYLEITKIVENNTTEYKIRIRK